MMSNVALNAEKSRRRNAGLKLFGLPYAEREAAKQRGGLWDGEGDPKCWLMPSVQSLLALGAVKKSGQYGPYWVMPKEGESQPDPEPAQVEAQEEPGAPFLIYVIKTEEGHLDGYTDQKLAEHMARLHGTGVHFVEVHQDKYEEPAEEPPPSSLPADVSFSIGGPCSKCGAPIGEDELCTECFWPARFG